MENIYKLQTDHLALSLTKPAKQFGVPLVAFYFNCMGSFLGCMLLITITQQGLPIFITFTLMFFIVHLTMVWITFKDAFGLRIFWIHVMHFKKHTHFRKWGNTDSFSP